jgi:hypothetical protein
MRVPLHRGFEPSRGEGGQDLRERPERDIEDIYRYIAEHHGGTIANRGAKSTGFCGLVSHCDWRFSPALTTRIVCDEL